MSSSRAVQRGRLRIIGGQWKKRLIRFNGAADLSEEAQFDPERINRFKSVITDLYKVIYESTMTAVSGEQRNRGPDKPIYDPDADNGESYGRVRLWVRELRNYYQHDVQSRKGWGGYEPARPLWPWRYFIYGKHSRPQQTSPLSQSNPWITKVGYLSRT